MSSSESWGAVCSLLLVVMGLWGLRQWRRSRDDEGAAEKLARLYSSSGLFGPRSARIFVKRLWIACLGLILQGAPTTVYTLRELGVDMGRLGDPVFLVWMLLAASMLCIVGVILPVAEARIRRT